MPLRPLLSYFSVTDNVVKLPEVVEMLPPIAHPVPLHLLANWLELD